MSGPDAPAYAELQAVSNFSFLQGGSHGEELVAQAGHLGLAALGLADRNTLAGVVRAHVAAKRLGTRLLVGARLDLRDAPSLICYPRDREAYGRLSSLLTRGQRRAEKGRCLLDWTDVAEHAAGQVLIVLPPEPGPGPEPGKGFEQALGRIAGDLDEAPYLAAHHLYRGDDRRRIAALARLAERCGTPLVATNDVLYHVPERRPLQDVLTCIREGCTLAQAGRRLAANAERHLKPPAEMARLFAGHPEALARTLEIAGRCRFSLDELRYEYPDEPVPPGRTPQQHLEALTLEGAEARYPDGVPDRVRQTLARELALIEQLGYAPYFLTVHDIVSFARSREILCQGRGSAANSAVCYCLGITAVDPTQVDLLFERFVSAERGEPPDIDVDFEHERREEVIQYIYERYGRDRAGIAATVIRYRSRSAIREVGKVMGLSADTTGALAGTVWGIGEDGMPAARVREAGLDPDDPHLARTLALARELMGFPRHLSQHVGGFVLTRRPLSEVVPIGNAAMADRTVVEWDKDDLDALGLLKVDVLALGMLTCIRKCFDLLRGHGGPDLALATVPQEDPAVYDMLCRADSLGVFQVESRAQMNMLPRLKPRCFYDLVIEVAIVRPGPIQGDMVHPYLRRRDGLEPVEYPSPSPEHGPPDELRRILHKTLGVPLFQEQAMRLAIDAANFTADEANELRHAMATFRRHGTIGRLKDRLIGRLVERGYDPDFAERCFRQIQGFGDYGFPESHSASFAKLVYVSSWLKCHHPAAFACGLLNSQPMGFYAPAQIVRDAREHGVEVRAVDVNHSAWDCTLEPAPAKAGERDDRGRLALRLGMRQVSGLQAEAAARIAGLRYAPYADVAGLQARTGVGVAVLERLAAADAFRSMGLDRRAALWQVRALQPAPLPLFEHARVRGDGPEEPVELPAMGLSEHVVADYQTLRLSLKAHPCSFLRGIFRAEGVTAAEGLWAAKNNARVTIAGVVLVRQRPGTAKGVVFATLEDETGIVNAIVWPQVLERHRSVVMGARLMRIRGRVQRHEAILHVIADEVTDWTGLLLTLAEEGPATRMPHARADEPARGGREGPAGMSRATRRHPRDVRILPASRDFH